MSTVKVFSKIMANGGVSFNNTVDDLPIADDSNVGDSCIYDGQFWMHMSYDGYTGWISLFSMENTYIHTQESAAAVWTINHGMGSVDFSATVFDSSNSVVLCDIVATDDNTITVNLGAAEYGRCVVLFSSRDNARAGGGASINDAEVSEDTTWSSSEISKKLGEITGSLGDIETILDEINGV